MFCVNVAYKIMIINVVQSDINLGRKSLGNWNYEHQCFFPNKPFPYREKNNPIALACNRAGFINSHIAFKIYSDNFEPIELPKIALDFERELSEGKPVYPLEFEINPIEKIK